jgi:RNA polymerase sigma-70 factor, ECF subfamily
MELQFTNELIKSRPVVYSILNKFGFVEDKRADIYQDICIGAWKAYPQFRGEASFSTWIARIAKYQCITMLRKANTAIKTVAIDNMLYQISNDDTYWEPDMSILDTLSPTERRTIDLYIEGKSYKEIEAITGESGNKLRVRVSRIKEVLRKRVLEMELADEIY